MFYLKRPTRAQYAPLIFIPPVFPNFYLYNFEDLKEFNVVSKLWPLFYGKNYPEYKEENAKEDEEYKVF